MISINETPKAEQHSHAHKLLRECLKPYNIKYSENTIIIKNKYGKPFLAENPDIKYNISHADGISACIVTDSECGIDCENVRKFKPNVMKRAFSESETEIVLSAPEAERDLLFFRLWTLKEAYIKAIGMGLSYPMKKACFNFENNLINSDIQDYKFRQYILHNKKFIVSVAIEL